MIISDLNQLEVVEGANIVGGLIGFPSFSSSGSYNVIVSLSGDAASSSGSAVGYGPNAIAEEEHYSSAGNGKASASGSSISASSSPKKW
ncbi:MAG: hypothetical protein PUP91_27050 [Rhizonema sp. PD37]|nr:hypothetical protein [Rhizonema sp. PD37]